MASREDSTTISIACQSRASRRAPSFVERTPKSVTSKLIPEKVSIRIPSSPPLLVNMWDHNITWTSEPAWTCAASAEEPHQVWAFPLSSSQRKNKWWPCHLNSSKTSSLRPCLSATSSWEECRCQHSQSEEDSTSPCSSHPVWKDTKTQTSNRASSNSRCSRDTSSSPCNKATSSSQWWCNSLWCNEASADLFFSFYFFLWGEPKGQPRQTAKSKSTSILKKKLKEISWGKRKLWAEGSMLGEKLGISPFFYTTLCSRHAHKCYWPLPPPLYVSKTTYLHYTC